MSYQPFISGPGRVNDNVKLDANYYKITHIDDVFIPRLGYNTTANTWQATVFNLLTPLQDTGFRELTLTNVSELRLLQITGILIGNPDLRISLRQPAKMTRWGAGDIPEGEIDGLVSPFGAPIRLRELFSVQQKPIQLRGQNRLSSHRLRPILSLMGYLYELQALKGTTAPAYEPPIGGIE